jgi:hypothetical protein
MSISLHRIWDTSVELRLLTNKIQETMQNAQNTEIQLRVINLEDFYVLTGHSVLLTFYVVWYSFLHAVK